MFVRAHVSKQTHVFSNVLQNYNNGATGAKNVTK